jgi:lipid A 3-O-deacylase
MGPPLPRRLAVALAAFLVAAPAPAAELVLSLGIDDVLRDNKTAGLGLEYRAAPRWTLGRAALGFGVAGEVDADGDLWGGAGLVLTAPLAGSWRLDASVMPGAYSRGSGNDLGRTVPVFRSQIGASVALSPDWRAGVAFNHKSNAGTASDNPGVETLFLTLGRRF